MTEHILSGSTLASHLQRLPHDIVTLILQDVVGPFTFDKGSSAAYQPNIKHMFHGFFQEEYPSHVETEQSRRLGVALVLPSNSKLHNFCCQAWLTPAFKLGCTIHIRSMQALIKVAELLEIHSDIASFVVNLVINAGNPWGRMADESTGTVLSTTLCRLPALKRLHLRGLVVDVAFGQDSIPPLLSRLQSLSLEESRDSIDLSKLPRRLISLSLKKVHLNPWDGVSTLPRLQQLSLGLHSSKSAPALKAFASSPPLHALYLDTFEHQDIRILIQAVRAQVTSICADLDEKKLNKLPSWFFEDMSKLTNLSIIGHCDNAILTSIPKSVRYFGWMSMEQDLQTANTILKSLSNDSTLPGLQAIPALIYRQTSWFYGIRDEDEDERDIRAEAVQLTWNHLHDKRGLRELDFSGVKSPYVSIWEARKTRRTDVLPTARETVSGSQEGW